MSATIEQRRVGGGAYREEPENYLTSDYGIMSWLLTTDHKRIGLLYMISVTVFFFIGGAAATLGPAVGVIVLGLIGLAAGPLARALQLPFERFDTAVAALLLVFVLAFGGQGVLPWALGHLRREAPQPRRFSRRTR